MKLKGFSNYEIDVEQGTVYSYKSNRYIGCKHKNNGYWCITLWDDNKIQHKFLLHRLIWTVVNGEIPEGMEINHINEDKDNNSITNLSLMTHLDNIRWGTGIKRMKLKQSIPIVGLDNGELKIFLSSTRESTKLGYSYGNINSCLKNKRGYKTAYGYKWQYMDDYLADWWDREHMN